MSDKNTNTIGHRLVGLALEKKSSEFSAEVDVELSTRIAPALDQKRQEVAQGVFTSTLHMDDE